MPKLTNNQCKIYHQSLLRTFNNRPNTISVNWTPPRRWRTFDEMTFDEMTFDETSTPFKDFRRERWSAKRRPTFYFAILIKRQQFFQRTNARHEWRGSLFFTWPTVVHFRLHLCDALQKLIFCYGQKWLWQDF